MIGLVGLNKKPELLSPAGDEESFAAALDFGADAVYLAGKSFGMRAGAKNFGSEALHAAVKAAHARGVKVYLACNTVPLGGELNDFPEFISDARDAGIDAVIAADLGVIAMVREYAPGVAIHASTQTGVVNWRTALELYKLGVSRVVPARELSLEDIREMRSRLPDDMEIEVFVHGAMCVSFSGRCLISEYLTGRNANRGQCAQPCRWKYSLVEEKRPGEYYGVVEEDGGSYILNARDMCMIEHLAELAEAGAASFKIEGRAKSAYYTAIITNAYRAALDALARGEKPPEWALAEVGKVSHRPYCTGFFYGHPNEGSGSQDPGEVTNGGQYLADSSYIRDYDFAGVIDFCEDGVMHITQRNHFTLSDELEIIEAGKAPRRFAPEKMYGEDGEETDTARHALEKLAVPTAVTAAPRSILRKKVRP